LDVGSAYSQRTVDASQTGGTVFSETPLECKRIGESINEAKIVLSQESEGLSAKSHYPKKDGVIACQPAAKTQTSGAHLRRLESAKDLEVLLEQGRKYLLGG
jgi:hypothetical protein